VIHVRDVSGYSRRRKGPMRDMSTLFPCLGRLLTEKTIPGNYGLCLGFFEPPGLPDHNILKSEVSPTSIIVTISTAL
jgi:hypothetical protein